MATRGNARWKNKRRKSLYNKEDTSNKFIYRSSSPSPAPDPSLDSPVASPPLQKAPTLSPPLPALSLPPPEPSINDPSIPSTPLAPPTPFRENVSLKALIQPTPLIAPPTPFKTHQAPTNDLPKVFPSPPPIAPPTPFRALEVPTNDLPICVPEIDGRIASAAVEERENEKNFENRKSSSRGKKRKKRKVDDEEVEASQIENDIAIYLDVNKICRMEIDKLDKIQNEILTVSDEDCIRQANEEMKQSRRFDKETQERINDSIRKRIDAIEMHVKRKKEMLLCTQETLTPRAIVHKLSAHASKVINTPF
ncbi:PREDICTED: actin cytoskeleton-regulatory complex protein PAN1-like [Amphimedon queenslandica]|uniref:Uncharacterized protein n=1 Tax=Amphimedon queenslandica TaxID=400682 RepID=A0A1X7UA30_AMPQE|nr:PREDICTED: actin cytoskeleton-regulatory complex protein PAN1-like [Amphimedon queenslandica]|eukprot:XP_003388550.1 PREDICTED: actin cytoskeleton-regulatory complex protein PAN1-like [Amphimedon queenslandica]